jgi:CBS domain-containing protein
VITELLVTIKKTAEPIARFLVKDDAGRLSGIITNYDLLEFFCRHDK